MNNDLYSRHFRDPQGRIYHYDPEQDIYYRRSQPQSLWNRLGWIAVTLILAIAAYLVTP